ncbi:MAG: dipeptidase [Planctomycetota bacterium]|nr:dipeptidase [Planctomycetota bacterium]
MNRYRVCMNSNQQTVGDVMKSIEDHFDEAVARLQAILRIPSISTDPTHFADVRAAADWFDREFRSLGFECEVVDTPGHPVVFAERKAPSANAPTILYYGHYDVQPADPLDQWNSPPFEPVIVDDENGGRIVARGAVDDKGQVMTFIEAFRAWIDATGDIPVSIKVMLEGEEESGSESLEGFLDAFADRLAADVCVVSDTGMWNGETPAITTMLRGMVYLEAEIRGPGHDLHSGMYGGAIANPINVLARIIASMHQDDGTIAVPDFYDGVEDPLPHILDQWRDLGFDEAGFLASAEISAATGGETGRTILERTWSRPTLDVNGILGGYTGAGAKTIIPATCSAKISCRLVPGQDPTKIEASLRAFIEAGLPKGFSVAFISHGVHPAVVVPADSPWLAAATAGLAEAYDVPAAVIGSGGSIPAVGDIQSKLGIDALLVGFGLDEDRVHSPNEKFDLRCLRGGIKSHAGMIGAFAARSAD